MVVVTRDVQSRFAFQFDPFGQLRLQDFTQEDNDIDRFLTECASCFALGIVGKAVFAGRQQVMM